MIAQIPFDAIAFGVMLPLMLPVLGACALLLSSGAPVTQRGESPAPGGHLAVMAVLSLGAAAVALVVQTPGVAMSGAVALDGIAVTLGVAALGASALSIVLAMAYLVEHELAVGEYCALVCLGSAGMLSVVMAQDALTLFVGLELMSIAAYVLTGFRRALRRSQEAALKYFMYGAFASATMVFGMALIWGEVGVSLGEPSLTWADLHRAVGHTTQPLSQLGWVGVALLVSGMAFKVGAAPFHMWAPDVYEGAPTPSAAFVSVGVKIAAFAGLSRLVLAAFGHGVRDAETSAQVLEFLAVASMVVGNVLALRQTQIKRMLAYSSVAHAGYVLTGLVGLVRDDAQAPVTALAAASLYLVGYAASALGAFAVISAFEQRADRRVDLHIQRLAGAGRKHPWLGAAMTLFLLSLAGIPPAAGFTGKVALLQSALGAGRITVVLVAVLSSVVGAFYYLRVVGVMLMQDAASDEPCVRSPWLTWALCACAAGALGLGVYPDFYYSFAHRALVGFAG
jgi:NADH-quinone oxidoreductase subunit N